ncbi:hypothetical protein B0H14DRAFT_1596979 [Mycena olivaceomarginata]|nr:hypothetical protein B0H14DRAFT_1596979 [Mycena olivaceomarginata]
MRILLVLYSPAPCLCPRLGSMSGSGVMPLSCHQGSSELQSSNSSSGVVLPNVLSTPNSGLAVHGVCHRHNCSIPFLCLRLGSSEWRSR